MNGECIGIWEGHHVVCLWLIKMYRFLCAVLGLYFKYLLANECL